MDKQKLYNELIELRETLRINSPESSFKGKNGYYITKNQKICSDEAIYAMINTTPIRKEDLAALPSVGDTFMNKYADDFFAIIQKYKRMDIELNHVDFETTKKLRSFQDKD